MLAVSKQVPVPEALALSELALNSMEFGEFESGGSRSIVPERGLWLHLWMGDRPAVVLGSGCRFAEDIAPACKLPVYRRISGGGTVVVGPQVWCYSFVWPRSFDPGGIHEAFRLVQGFAAATLKRLGLHVQLQPISDLAVKRSGGELRKIAGHGQKRRRSGTLCEGSLIAEPFPFPLSSVLRHPVREPPYRHGRKHEDFITSVREESGEASFEDFVRSMASVLGAERVVEIPAELLNEAGELSRRKYQNEEWIRRL